MKRGFSVIELGISLTLTALISLLLLMLYNASAKSQKIMREASDLDARMIRLSALILHTGRLSKNCNKVLGGGPTYSLICDIDPGSANPPYSVRFAFHQEEIPCSTKCRVEYERQNAGAWKTIETFNSLEFLVCDSAEILGGTCTSLNSPAYVPPLGSDRFFRFRLTGFQSNGSSSVFQSAFTQRNVGGTESYSWIAFGERDG